MLKKYINKRETEFKMMLTPITKETFERQGWKYVEAEDIRTGFSMEDGDMMEGMIDYYYVLNLPKNRNDEFANCLISNLESERIMLYDMGVLPGQFVVTMGDTDGLGLCRCEEEIEVLYRALTGYDIYDDVPLPPTNETIWKVIGE